MARGKTLWEMLVEKFQTPVELQFYNPLKARIGNAVMINEVDLRDYNFFLTEIREYRRAINHRLHFFADYVVLARPLGGEDVLCRLRLMPIADPEKAAGLTHQVLLLNLYEEMGYDKDLHNVVNDTTKKFQILQDGVVAEEYWRINDVSSPYTATVAVVRDVNRDNKVEKSEVERVKLDYWDYWRETKEEVGGAPLLQYLFIEMNAENGWFQMWRGREVDPQLVMVM